jgi:formate-dependent nitrite reductase membrane component NrfD
MSDAEVTREGLRNRRPGREALTGAKGGRRRRRGGEQPVVPDAQFTSYYGKPIINSPVWKPTDIAGYLFLGGLAGASSGLALASDLTGRSGLAKVSKSGAAAAISLSLAALVHDLGRPGRFINMLRVFKVTSPMNVGSWLLSGYAPAAIAAAGSAWTGLLPRIGTAATAAAAAAGPAVATYTGALIADTAVPAWHDGYREMPFLFAGSSAAAAGGLGLLAGPAAEAGVARRLSVLGAVVEVAAGQRMERRLGKVAEPYSKGKSGMMMKAGEAMMVAGAAMGAASRRRPVLGRVAGGLMLTASAITRFAIFEAGMTSAKDPKYTVQPQRERLDGAASADHAPTEGHSAGS